jgi:predicted transcriptional regulator
MFYCWRYVWSFLILLYMKQILVEIDDDLLERLDRVAPSRSRRRSEFVRNAIRQALWDLEEKATAAAYRRQPDTEADAYLNSHVWEPERKPHIGRRRG